MFMGFSSFSIKFYLSGFLFFLGQEEIKTRYKNKNIKLYYINDKELKYKLSFKLWDWE